MGGIITVDRVLLYLEPVSLQARTRSFSSDPKRTISAMQAVLAYQEKIKSGEGSSRKKRRYFRPKKVGKRVFRMKIRRLPWGRTGTKAYSTDMVALASDSKLGHVSGGGFDIPDALRFRNLLLGKEKQIPYKIIPADLQPDDLMNRETAIHRARAAYIKTRPLLKKLYVDGRITIPDPPREAARQSNITAVLGKPAPEEIAAVMKAYAQGYGMDKISLAPKMGRGAIHELYTFYDPTLTGRKTGRIEYSQIRKTGLPNLVRDLVFMKDKKIVFADRIPGKESAVSPMAVLYRIQYYEQRPHGVKEVPEIHARVTRNLVQQSQGMGKHSKGGRKPHLQGYRERWLAIGLLEKYAHTRVKSLNLTGGITRLPKGDILAHRPVASVFASSEQEAVRRLKKKFEVAISRGVMRAAKVENLWMKGGEMVIPVREWLRYSRRLRGQDWSKPAAAAQARLPSGGENIPF